MSELEKLAKELFETEKSKKPIAVFFKSKHTKMNKTIYTVAHLYGVLPQEITSHKRGRIFSDARAVCCYILHRWLRYSSKDVARTIGITHSAVLYNARRVQDWIDDPRINPQAVHILETIRQK